MGRHGRHRESGDMTAFWDSSDTTGWKDRQETFSSSSNSSHIVHPDEKIYMAWNAI
jgi:hypothetical protein